MEKLIIQQNNRHGRLSEFTKSTKTTMSVGRGLTNDLILSDPFIAAEQVRFEYSDEKWQLKILDSTNPILINDIAIENDITVKSGDQLTIGRTPLTLLLSSHSSEPVRELILTNWMNHKALRLTLPLVMLIISTLTAVLNQYQESTGIIKWGHLTSGGLSYIAVILVWSGCWSIVSRVIRHKSSYLEQLFYTALIMSVLNIGTLFTGYIEFSTTSNALGFLMEWGFIFIALSYLLKYNLIYATELKKRSHTSFLVVALSMLLILVMQHLVKNDFDTQPNYSQTLKPPIAKWSADKSIDTYMKNISKQFKEHEE